MLISRAKLIIYFKFNILMKYIISFLLALLPLFSWTAQYHLSKKDNLLNSFKKHWTCYYGDWIFILINFLFLFSIKITPTFFYLIPVSILISIFTHKIWRNKNKTKKRNSHFFFNKTNKLNSSGITHLIFSSIQITIIISIFLSPPILSLFFVELILIMLFAILMTYGSYKIHSQIDKLDLIASVLLVLFVIIRYLFLFI